MRSRGFKRVGAGVVVLAVLAGPGGTGAGCRQKRVTHPAPATRATADGGGTFDRPDLGVRLSLPAGWTARPSQDFVLVLQRDVGASGGAPSISLDVPTLPFHIPGLIPIGSVRGGYLDDLRKAVGKIETEDLATPPLPSAAVRFVRSTWTDDQGRPAQETALLVVHGDRVYILRGRSSVADEPAARGAFDGIVRSMTWTNGPTSRPAARTAPVQ